MYQHIRMVWVVALTILWGMQPAVSHEGEDHKKKPEQEHREHQEEHSHKAPHGGMVVTVGEYHYEMVVQEEAVLIYLLNGKEETLPVSQVTGSAMFQVPGKAAKKVELVSDKDHFRAGVDLKEVEKFVAVISLKMDGKTQVGRFSYQKAEDHEKEAHHKGGEHGEHHH